MGEKAISIYTYEAYLAVEAESELKYEFHDGMITAMAGGTPEHGIIASNFIQSLPKFDSCTIFSSDVKIHIQSSNRTFYPDASIVCGDYQRSEKDKNALVNPILILEVLSESTAAFDRGAKFSNYRKISSLREYVLISQDEAMVDTYFRTESGLWEIKTILGLETEVELKSVNCKISMRDIYRMLPNIS
ncbi:MAG: Uma2 family endonuclease [Bacteroidota bacterium]